MHRITREKLLSYVLLDGLWPRVVCPTFRLLTRDRDRANLFRSDRRSDYLVPFFRSVLPFRSSTSVPFFRSVLPFRSSVPFFRLDQLTDRNRPALQPGIEGRLGGKWKKTTFRAWAAALQVDHDGHHAADARAVLCVCARCCVSFLTDMQAWDLTRPCTRYDIGHTT